MHASNSDLLRDLEARGHHEAPLLDEPSVTQLLELAAPLVAATEDLGFSDHVLGASQRQALHRQIRAIVDEPIAALLPGHRVVSASLVAKQPGRGDLGWHIDPSITDERRWRSLSCWIPLVPTSARNGSLELLSGGHRGAPLDRGGLGTLAKTHPDGARSVAACRAAGGEPSGPLHLDAGWTSVYDHRLPHRSGPNRSGRPRVAVNVGLVPAPAPLLVHIWDASDHVRAIEVDDGYFASADLDATPSPRT